MFKKQKKGAIIIPIVVALALVIILWNIVGTITKECTGDRQCNVNEYCGSDFKCHEHPQITNNNFIPAATIMGFAIIAAAIIMRWRKKK